MDLTFLTLSFVFGFCFFAFLGLRSLNDPYWLLMPSTAFVGGFVMSFYLAFVLYELFVREYYDYVFVLDREFWLGSFCIFAFCCFNAVGRRAFLYRKKLKIAKIRGGLISELLKDVSIIRLKYFLIVTFLLGSGVSAVIFWIYGGVFLFAENHLLKSVYIPGMTWLGMIKNNLIFIVSLTLSLCPFLSRKKWVKIFWILIGLCALLVLALFNSRGILLFSLLWAMALIFLFLPKVKKYIPSLLFGVVFLWAALGYLRVSEEGKQKIEVNYSSVLQWQVVSNLYPPVLNYFRIRDVVGEEVYSVDVSVRNYLDLIPSYFLSPLGFSKSSLEGNNEYLLSGSSEFKSSGVAVSFWGEARLMHGPYVVVLLFSLLGLFYAFLDTCFIKAVANSSVYLLLFPMVSILTLYGMYYNLFYTPRLLVTYLAVSFLGILFFKKRKYECRQRLVY